MAYDVLVLSADLSASARHVVEFFQDDVVTSRDQLPQRMKQKHYRVLVLDQVAVPQLDLHECEMLVQQDYVKGTPVVVLTSSPAVTEKIKALEIGCDDLIDSKTAPDELAARITKSIFHQIANSQLSQRLNQATETARSAMVDNSDLGANIQFLLQIHNCDNLDQLGQQFFATIARYGLSCSLQMRSEMGKKDMEAHGMAKH